MDTAILDESKCSTTSSQGVHRRRPARLQPAQHAQCLIHNMPAPCNRCNAGNNRSMYPVLTAQHQGEKF